jgi:hypothetical protein
MVAKPRRAAETSLAICVNKAPRGGTLVKAPVARNEVLNETESHQNVGLPALVDQISIQ